MVYWKVIVNIYKKPLISGLLLFNAYNCCSYNCSDSHTMTVVGGFLVENVAHIKSAILLDVIKSHLGQRITDLRAVNRNEIRYTTAANALWMSHTLCIHVHTVKRSTERNGKRK